MSFAYRARTEGQVSPVHPLLAGVFADWDSRGGVRSALPGAPVVADQPRRVPRIAALVRRWAPSAGRVRPVVPAPTGTKPCPIELSAAAPK
jgi:hypothetical protein